MQKKMDRTIILIRGEKSIFSTEEAAILFSFISFGIIITSLAIFGFFGNIFNIFVLSSDFRHKKKNRNSALSLILTGLAVSDCSVCFLILIFGSVEILSYFQVWEEIIIKFCGFYVYLVSLRLFCKFELFFKNIHLFFINYLLII